MLQSFVHTSVVMPVCGPDDKVLKHRKYADRLLRNMLSYGLRDNLNYKSIADKLYRKAMDMIVSKTLNKQIESYKPNEHI
ncbi:hypothetical protein DPMN_031702 [Dreissena polymorpha]|uniref:Uncharacterized protein n=1 Tax=Dreissena polymorpha TaxID=45954 RepID=A0A9D4M1J1_DREPO|nr:hypothetical protein DPMN_031702 [Dreissena polymorpha]